LPIRAIAVVITNATQELRKSHKQTLLRIAHPHSALEGAAQDGDAHAFLKNPTIKHAILKPISAAAFP
jgi:hypothetical protein